MNIITVIPIVKGIANQKFSYFSATNIQTGSLVSVPMRKKEVPALVLSVEKAMQSRQEIRSADFQLRKIGHTLNRRLFSEHFMQMVQDTSVETAIDIEILLPSLVPLSILENAKSLPELDDSHEKEKSNTINERCAFESILAERVVEYKNVVRGSFARNESVYLAVPTVAHAQFLSSELSRGIESRVILLHSSLSKKKQFSQINSALISKKSICIIATPIFMSIPRTDFGTIVIERELSQAYRQVARPYLDYRVALENLAYRTHSKLIRADLPLGVETYWRAKEGKLNLQSGIQKFSQVSSKIVFTDMRPVKTASEKIIPTPRSKKLQIIGKDLAKQVERTIDSTEKLLIFSPRRGHSPMTLCDDCGNVVVCEKCGSNVVLHTKKDKRVFICHHCTTERSARTRCRECSSWKLTDLGIGIEKTHDAIINGWPKSNVFMIDGDSTPTHSRARAEWNKFVNAERGILIGTNLALPYATAQIEHTAVVSADTLLSLPEWNSAERTFSILLHLAQIATRSCVIQTRHPDSTLIKHLMQGDQVKWYTDELRDRKALRYPPYTVLINVTASSSPACYQADRNILRKTFQKWNPFIYEPKIQTPRRKNTSVLLKIANEEWPQKELAEALSSLPRHITVKINPDRII